MRGVSKVSKQEKMDIKDQIVSLQIELEDKDKVIGHLEEKLSILQDDLLGFEATLSGDYLKRLQKKSDKANREFADLAAHVEQLQKEKANLLEENKALAYQITQTEKDHESEWRNYYRQELDNIEKEKKKFKAGSDERLKKFMAQKSQEYKEQTLRAMDPEFQRLTSLHEAELQIVNNTAQQQERDYLFEQKAKLEAAKEEEKNAAREEWQYMLRNIQERSAKELAEIGEEYKAIHRRITYEQEQEIQKIERAYKVKYSQYQEECHEEMAALQLKGQQRLLDVKRQHVKMMEQMKQEHQQKIQDLEQDHQRALVQLEAKRLRHSRNSSNSHHERKSPNDRRRNEHNRRRMLMDDDDDEEEAGNRKSYKQDGSRLPPSPNKKAGIAGTAPAGGGSSSSSGSNNGSGLSSPLQEMIQQLTSPHHREQLLALQTQLEEKRTATLQGMIRSLELEAIREERKQRSLHEEEKKKLLELTSKEQANLTSKDTYYQQEIADLIVEREQLLSAVQEETQRVQHYQEQIKTIKEEITIYREGIAAHTSRQAEKQEQAALAIRACHLQYHPLQRDLQIEIDQIEQAMSVYQQAWQQEQQGKEEEHAQELQALDKTVKDQVKGLEDEIATMKELVSNELAKEKKLILLLNQYRNNNGGGETKHQSGQEDEEDDHEEEEELHVTPHRYDKSSSSRKHPSSASGIGPKSAAAAGPSSVYSAASSHRTVGSNKSYQTATTASYSLAAGHNRVTKGGGGGGGGTVVGSSDVSSSRNSRPSLMHHTTKK